MLDPKVLEEIGNKFAAAVKNSPVADLEKNARLVASGLFAKLDLVTRDEFDVQAQVLLRTRERLEQLEARVAALEAQAKPKAR
ncbi:Ubiquinone biosynthesis accessory factor UbiK [Burkholderiales bacterium]|nr:MAG: accessory factor UbiK family protein [Burkholderiales bacterium]CAG0984315.1 Ubiquinone biosynthesis accessory factor UbiK [Burkholderiales bacterium]